MGKISGDKSRYNRNRRKKIERRAATRALGLKAAAKPAPAEKADPAPSSDAE